MVTKPDCTAHTLWLNIEALSCDNNEACIMELENKVRQMTMGDKLINEFYERMKVIADLLGIIGNPVTESTLVTYFLNGLSPKYDHIGTIICHK